LGLNTHRSNQQLIGRIGTSTRSTQTTSKDRSSRNGTSIRVFTTLFCHRREPPKTTRDQNLSSPPLKGDSTAYYFFCFRPQRKEEEEKKQQRKKTSSLSGHHRSTMSTKTRRCRRSTAEPRDGNGNPIPDSPRGIPPLGDGDGSILIPAGT
jgi:hypothetical protein